MVGPIEPNQCPLGVHPLDHVVEPLRGQSDRVSAAIDAIAEGNYVEALRLLEWGNFRARVTRDPPPSPGSSPTEEKTN